MKKLGFSLLVSIVVIYFAACSLEPPAMGHLTISVPAGIGKSISATGPRTLATPTAIRVYIQLHGVFIKGSGEKDYVQAALTSSTGNDSNTVTIDLSPSSGYQVFVALGDASSGWSPSYYGNTDSFTVSPGVYTQESLTVSPVPFSTVASSSSTLSAVIDGKLWELYGGSIHNVTDGISVSLPGAITSISSFSEGSWFNGQGGFASELWLNTNSGLWAVSADGSSLTLRSSSMGVNATASGAIVSDITQADGSVLKGTLLIFSYGSDVQYAYSNSGSPTSAIDGTWTTGGLNAYLQTDDSFKKLIPDPGSFVKAYAFVLNGNSSYGFISTALGSFIYNQSVQTAIGNNAITWLKGQLTSSSYALSASIGGKSQAITSLVLDDPTNPTTIYAGTNTGLFSGASSSAQGINPPALTQVAAAGNASVVKLAAASLNGTSYSAFVDAQGNLNLLSGTTLLHSYPFYSFSGSPGAVSSLSFYQAGGVLSLIVSSAEGVATLQVSP